MFFPLAVILNHMSRDLTNYQVVSIWEKLMNHPDDLHRFEVWRQACAWDPWFFGMHCFVMEWEWQWIQRSELVLTFDFELGLELWNEFPYTQETRLWLAGIFRWCVWFYVGAEHGDLAWKVWECWFQFQCVGSVFHDSTCTAKLLTS